MFIDINISCYLNLYLEILLQCNQNFEYRSYDFHAVTIIEFHCFTDNNKKSNKSIVGEKKSNRKFQGFSSPIVDFGEEICINTIVY